MRHRAERGGGTGTGTGGEEVDGFFGGDTGDDTTRLYLLYIYYNCAVWWVWDFLYDLLGECVGWLGAWVFLDMGSGQMAPAADSLRDPLGRC